MLRKAAAEISRRGRRFASTLAFEEIPSQNAEQNKTVMFVHGLLGSGRNWRGFAKLLQPAIPPEWRIVLVDLRNHGQSSQLQLPPPHTISSAATDVANLIKARPELQPDVLIGHSMGGKVVLDFVKQSMENAFGSDVKCPSQLWVLDSVVGEVPIKEEEGEVERVLKTIRTLPNPIPSRRWLLDHMQGLGFSKGLGHWLGSNLKGISSNSEEGTWIFNLDGAYDMFKSYRQSDYWSLLESPPPDTDIGLIRAEKSDRWTSEIISRLEELSREKLLMYHVLKDAGHWLHVDNPDGLLEILLPSFETRETRG